MFSSEFNIEKKESPKHICQAGILFFTVSNIICFQCQIGVTFLLWKLIFSFYNVLYCWGWYQLIYFANWSYNQAMLPSPNERNERLLTAQQIAPEQQDSDKKNLKSDKNQWNAQCQKRQLEHPFRLIYCQCQIPDPLCCLLIQKSNMIFREVYL